MKTIFILLLALFFSLTFSAQNKPHMYTQFDFAIPLKGNQDSENDNSSTDENYWFLPDGASGKIGFGFHQNRWLALGIHTGIDWKGSEKLVAVPVFANARISPRIGDNTRMYLQAGYGKSFAIGRGNLSGDYKKVSLGIESADGVSLFIELVQHDFTLHQIENINMLSIGISSIIFKGKTIAPSPASE